MQYCIKFKGFIKVERFLLKKNCILLEIVVERYQPIKYIGYIYVGCTDAVLFRTEDPEELRAMFAIAKSYSGAHRYTVHPQMNQVVCKHCS